MSLAPVLHFSLIQADIHIILLDIQILAVQVLDQDFIVTEAKLFSIIRDVANSMTGVNLANSDGSMLDNTSNIVGL